MSWCPDTARIKKKMLYSSSFDALKKALVGVHKYIQVSWSWIMLKHLFSMTNLTIFCPVKIEYGWKFSISGLKMMVKSGLEKIFLKFLHVLTIFYKMNLPHRKEGFWSKVQIQ